MIDLVLERTNLFFVAGLVFAAGLLYWPLRQAFGNVRQATRSVLASCVAGIEGFRKWLADVVPAIADGCERAGSACARLLVVVAEAHSRTSGPLRDALVACSTRTARFGLWKACGALLFFAAFLAFLYTDAALVLASETSVFGRADLPLPTVPEFMRNTTYPLIIAFLVSLLAVGVVRDDIRNGRLFDWGAVTENRVELAASWMVGVSIIFLLAGATLGRIPDMLPAGYLSPGQQDHFTAIGSISLNLVSVPIAVIVFLLLRPVPHAVVLIVSVVATLFLAGVAAVWSLVGLALRLAVISAPMVASGTVLAARFLVSLWRGVLAALSWCLRIAEELFGFLLLGNPETQDDRPGSLVLAMVYIVAWVPRSVAAWMRRMPFVRRRILFLGEPATVPRFTAD